MKMKLIFIITTLFSSVLFAQFASTTTKKIDIIENNTATDITINPTNKVIFPYLNDGDLAYEDTGITGLAIGSNGQLLSASALGFPEWIDAPSSSPTTTEGDIIVRGATEDERLPIGGSDQLLTSNGTTASWQNAPVSVSVTTKGDLQGFDSVANRIPVGSDGTFLIADSAEALGVKWSDTLTGTLNPVTDVSSIACTSAWTTNTTTACKTSQIGDRSYIEWIVTLTGAPNAATLVLNLPAGMVIDTAKLGGTGTLATYGTCNGINGSTGIAMEGLFNNTTSIVIASNSAVPGQSVVNATAPVTWGSGDKISCNITVPIVGQSSGTSAAVQNKTLAIVKANGNSSEVLTANVTNIPFSTETKDNNNLWNGTSLTPTEDGEFQVEGAIFTSASTLGGIKVYIDGVFDFFIGPNHVSATVKPFNGVVSLLAGEVMTIRTDTNATLDPNGDVHLISIVELPINNVIVGTFAENATKCQTKILSASITSDADGDISDLDFANLTIGKRYTVKTSIRTQATSSTAFSWDYADADCPTLTRIGDAVTTSVIQKHYTECSFTATSTSLPFTVSDTDGNRTLFGDGSRIGSTARLCQLPSSEVETTEF